MGQGIFKSLVIGRSVTQAFLLTNDEGLRTNNI
jgi:hypothetical protein